MGSWYSALPPFADIAAEDATILPNCSVEHIVIDGLNFYVRTVNFNTINVADDDNDDGDARELPILLCHGFPEGWFTWIDLAFDLLAKNPRQRLIIPDLRGYNFNDKPAAIEHYSIDKLVSDVTVIVETMIGPISATNRFHLVGHDWGGILAWTYASLHPKEVATLTILNAPHPNWLIGQLKIPGSPQSRRSSYMPVLATRFATALLTAFNSIFLRKTMPKRIRNGPYFYLYEASWRQANAVDAACNWYRANLQFPHWLSWRGFKSEFDASGSSLAIDGMMPTLVCWGLKDPLFALPGALDGLQDYTTVGLIKIVHLSRAGHFPCASASSREIIVEEMREHFQRAGTTHPAHISIHEQERMLSTSKESLISTKKTPSVLLQHQKYPTTNNDVTASSDSKIESRLNRSGDVSDIEIPLKYPKHNQRTSLLGPHQKTNLRPATTPARTGGHNSKSASGKTTNDDNAEKYSKMNSIVSQHSKSD